MRAPTSREISVSAAIALARASSHPADPDRDRQAPGCRFAGALRPGDAYWFKGQTLGDDGTWCFQQVHRVIVVWGPRLDTTSDIFGRDLIRFWIWDPATGNEGSATFGPRGQVLADLDGPNGQYWIPAPGTLDPAAEAALSHHPKCECGTCRPDLATTHHPDCQCTTCQPGKWTPAQAGDPERSSGMTDTYYVEVDSADVMGVRDAVFGLGDSGVHLSGILPLADGKKTAVNWWDDREQAEQAASRLTQAGFPARAKPHGQSRRAARNA